MFSNLSAAINESVIDYPIMDNSLPFAEYIALCRAIIEERRTNLSNLNKPGFNAKLIIDANSPYELYPGNPIRTGKQLKYGALLIHGLLDCPFSLRDIGERLQRNGILSRAILLPGHGTSPADLISVSYHNWLQAVHYGVETLRREVEQVFLVGYSTGAALSVYQALQDRQIAGIILLSPAIRIKAPVNFVVGWHYLLKCIGRNDRQWFYHDDEIDYAKYQSIAFNPINQVAHLTKVIQELRQHHPFTTPIFMVISREDEIVSSLRAIDFFSSHRNLNSKLLLYTSVDPHYSDPRIFTRLTNYSDLPIKHLSHIAIPFSPNNLHYGNSGDYIFASRTDSKEFVYGAYNRIEEKSYDLLYKLGLAERKRRDLTFNPDFDFMAGEIIKFVLS